jgi:hypothetical protein
MHIGAAGAQPGIAKGQRVHLVQILVPVRDNASNAFSPHLFEAVAESLTTQFGGVTAYNRAPAEGRWRSSGKVQHDEVVVMEVMVEALDRDWWRNLRADLEQRQSQERGIIRAQSIELL